MEKIKVHSIKDYNRGYVTLNERGNEADGIVLYRKVDSKGNVEIYYIEAPEEERNNLVSAAYDDIIQSGMHLLDKYESEKNKTIDEMIEEPEEDTIERSVMR